MVPTPEMLTGQLLLESFGLKKGKNNFFSLIKTWGQQTFGHNNKDTEGQNVALKHNPIR